MTFTSPSGARPALKTCLFTADALPVGAECIFFWGAGDGWIGLAPMGTPEDFILGLDFWCTEAINPLVILELLFGNGQLLLNSAICLEYPIFN